MEYLCLLVREALAVRVRGEKEHDRCEYLRRHSLNMSKAAELALIHTGPVDFYDETMETSYIIMLSPGRFTWKLKTTGLWNDVDSQSFCLDNSLHPTTIATRLWEWSQTEQTISNGVQNGLGGHVHPLDGTDGCWLRVWQSFRSVFESRP